MYIEYNPNPKGAKVGDCVVRAISKATGTDWNEAYAELCAYGYASKDMPSANKVWSKMLKSKGFTRDFAPFGITVAEFCEAFPSGTYILAIDGHAVAVKDGCYYDSWDSGHETVVYYWKRG